METRIRSSDRGPDTDDPAPGRSRRNRGSGVTRDALIDAGIEEFAANGFAGSSTRRIAQAADAHQSQIKYHFDTKDDLWKRCVERLLAELDAAIAANLDPTDTDVTASLAATIRGLVHFMAGRPQLNRIMAHEATRSSDRLTWLVDTHLAARHRALTTSWTRLAEDGVVAPIDPDVLYHTVIGAAALLYSNGPEAVLLGLDPSDTSLVERHADTLVALFLRPADAAFATASASEQRAESSTDHDRSTR